MRARILAGGRRWTAALALGLGGAAGCFAPDYLDYTACATSEGCAALDLDACVRLPAEPAVRGFCTLDCDGDAACPAGPDGDAAPRCAAIAGRDVCVLSCMAGETCPKGHVCVEIADAAGAVCFPEAA